MGLKDLFSGSTPPAPSAAPEPAPDVSPAPAATPAASASSAPATAGAAPDSAASTPSTAQPQAGSGAASASAPPSPSAAPPANAPASTPTGALNAASVQAVQFANSETAGYAPSQIAVGSNMLISQAGGLVAQAGATYFDGASKLALASKSVLLKNMTEKFAKEDLKGAAEDALGILITDLLVGTAAAVAAAAGAIEGEAAHLALDKIDQSLSKYQDLVGKKVS